MKKLISLLTIALFIPQLAFGWGLQGYVGSDGNFPHGVTFAAIYDADLDADISTGSPTATFAASRDATHPATYFNSSGVMQKTETSNVGRFNHGYYDTTGWHAFSNGAGVQIEGASTNYIKQSIFAADGNSDGVADNWAKADAVNVNGTPTTTLVDVSSTFNIGSTVNSQRLQYTGVAGDDATTDISMNAVATADGSFVQGENVTMSGFFKGSVADGLIKIEILERNAAGGFLNAFTLSSDFSSSISTTEWRYFTLSRTTTHADCSRIIAKVWMEEIADGESGDIQFTGVQVEKQPFATSFIPTTTAALTRNAETLKYVTLGNRTAAVESMVVKLAPEYANGVVGSKYIIASDTKNRIVVFTSVAPNNDVKIFPNNTNSWESYVGDLIDSSWTANSEMTIGCNVQSGTSPYITGFYNGVADGTNETTDDFTANAWGTYMWLGSDKDGANQLNGTIQSIAFFDRVLTAAEMLSLHDKDWRTLR